MDTNTIATIAIFALMIIIAIIALLVLSGRIEIEIGLPPKLKITGGESKRSEILVGDALTEGEFNARTPSNGKIDIGTVTADNDISLIVGDNNDPKT